MSGKDSRELPGEHEVWARVREFAEQRRASGRPIWTLTERVRNTITDVRGARIERASEKGKSNTTPIMRGELLRVWRRLVADGRVRKGDPNFFTLALLQAALPDYIDDLGDGSIALRHFVVSDASLASVEGRREFAYSEAASLARTSLVGEAPGRPPPRESDAHWLIKHFIYQRPDQALVNLPGGPWEPTALELTLPIPTSDRIDVIVRDSAGYRMLVEVKPRVLESSVDLYAQTAKYRAIWRVLHDLDIDEVRCAIAAPAIPGGIARHMYERHGIESVAVTVAKDFVAPTRDD